MVDVPSTAKSPMEIFSTIAKDIWAKELGYSRERVASVAIMPCLAKKYEASREEFSRGDNYDTDYVISTRELIKIFKESGIDLNDIEDMEFDNPLENILELELYLEELVELLKLQLEQLLKQLLEHILII